MCVAAAERPSGLRDTIPIGSQLTMRAGSAAQVLLAWEDPERMHRGLLNAAFSATALSGIRRRGWAQSIGGREQGVASVSAPVRSPGGKIIAAVSVSGPLERLSRQPGRMHAPAVLACPWSQVDDVVCCLHDIGIVLNHHNGVAKVAKFKHNADQPLSIARMQADRWFIEHIGRTHETRSKSCG